MMKAKYNDFEFVIEEEHPDVGVYPYVYQDGKCVQDFLQNDKATCIEIALEDCGVPKELWVEVSDEDNHFVPPPTR
jgi:hypothetical protein